MKHFLGFLLAILMVGLTLMSCKNSATNPTQSSAKQPPAKTITQQQTVSSSNAFGLSLLATLNPANKDSNVVISPLSVSIALGMTMNGANGATHDSMQHVLGFDGMSDSSIDQAYLGVINTLDGLDPSVAFNLANSIWYRDGFPVEDDFVSVSRTYFDAVVNALNFSDLGAATTINNWVNQQTNGKIPTIVEPPISPTTMMYLINAVYFKAAWTFAFDSTQTVSGTFLVQGETTYGHAVPMMKQKRKLLYVQNSSLQMVDLPYGNGNYRMSVLLPAGDIDAFVAGLNAGKFASWVSGLDSAEVWLSLPRFTIECKYTLKPALSTMGMSLAFDQYHADFSRIADVPFLHIDDVLHKTFIKVGEQGTEAAAVTSVEVGVSVVILPPQGTVIMNVDRPFVFVIRDGTTGTLLFVGKISNPLG